jgi:hypothetical protein
MKPYLSILANSVFGTWHLPMGLTLPDVDSADWTLNLHRFLTNQGDVRTLALGRAGLATVFGHVAKLGSIVLNHNVSKLYEGRGVIVDRDGNTLLSPTKSIFCPGSGIDTIRNRYVGLRDLSLVSEVFGDGGTGLDTNRFCTYLYETSSKHEKLSPEWFKRLHDAYRLNRQPDYISDEARQFVSNYFIPNITKVDSDSNLVRLPTYVAKRNMRFTLVGQSYGGTFIQMLINSLYEEMRKLKYEDKEIQDIFDNILVINISGATFAHDKLNRPRPKTIFMEHIYDFVGFQTDRHDVHPFYHPQNQSPSGVKVSDNVHFYWLNFAWKTASSSSGVSKPQDDPYGYHDVRATLQAVPSPVIRALQTSRMTYQSLSPLAQLLS